VFYGKTSPPGPDRPASLGGEEHPFYHGLTTSSIRGGSLVSAVLHRKSFLEELDTVLRGGKSDDPKGKARAFNPSPLIERVGVFCFFSPLGISESHLRGTKIRADVSKEH